MPLATTLLPEFDHEMKSMRAVLANVPDARADWKPHPKSTTLGSLAIHVAGMLGWIPSVLTATELDGASASPTWESTAATLAHFDRAVEESRKAILAARDEDLMVPWTLRYGTHVLLTMPRAVVLRTIIMNHVIHHRGQLTVYLRLNDVPVPEVYGPTADSEPRV